MYLLQTIHGVGKILSMTILYEIGDINRFPRVQEFASYSRLIKCSRESAGKRYGSAGSKIENVYLKWAFYQAAEMFLKGNPGVGSTGQKFNENMVRPNLLQLCP